MKRKQAVIIGGGLGGLATALRLTRAGWRVTVCEQSPTFGGKMNRWEQDGFRFDTGPSLITMRWVFAELFEAAGARMDEHLELIPMRPLAEYVYDDGTRFNYSSDLPDWLATVRGLEPRDVDGFYRFMELGARLFEISRETFFRRRPVDAPDLRSLKAMRHMPLRHAWGNYHRTVAAHFKNPHLRQLFDRYPTYVGSSPYESPATLAVIPYVEYAFGGWHIRGGLYRLVESLCALAARAGVTLRTGARVERIERDGRSVAIRSRFPRRRPKHSRARAASHGLFLARLRARVCAAFRRTKIPRRPDRIRQRAEPERPFARAGRRGRNALYHGERPGQRRR
jgi:phytoene desaturase